MQLTSVNIVRYPKPQGDAISEDINNPRPEIVMALVQRMDRSRQPILFLNGIDKAEKKQTMTVMGGAGKYCISVEVSGGKQIFAFFPAQRKNRLQIWTSDQGFTADGQFVVPDTKTALKIIHHWIHTGEKSTEFHWRNYPLAAL